eukprot:CAMPEP_0113401424 /NCGR_PEP_ID=MMETSP0013_2-20120614/16686_1 /TAXON_ID=2843 ORGANISM="Skeletonema costatum, Strain 1716" /NCGR_SAMPLE_ID=MMETSP0013_2 /ASSEMBLY_ACC=CAM_ASM_000158 /LENGTH=523 /DNA_ID=CAMNT_0000286633 /DNA_START=126 /DNA_END=1697 /DNA_ORIENTATION=+ /assembly_acc=CAM_ASM_000158
MLFLGLLFNAFSLSAALVAVRPSARSTHRHMHMTPLSPSINLGKFYQTNSKRNVAFSSNRSHSGHSSTQLSAAAAAASTNSGSKNKTIIATALLIFLDVQFRSLFTKYSIPFPSSLAGCGSLFATMIAVTSMKEEWGEAIYNTLNPGAGLLAKWLPVFFVPSLITLPLAGSLGNSLEILKLFTVIIGGFFFTLFTTAWSVLGIRRLMGGGDEKSNNNESATEAVAPVKATTNPPPKAFSTTLLKNLATLAGISGIAAVGAIKQSATQLITPLQSSFLLFTTLATFVFGANLPKSFIKTVHPLITCSSLTWVASTLMASLTGRTFIDIIKLYKAGISPLAAPLSTGAGDVLLFLLGPAVVALACQMYGRKKLMRENIKEVGISTIVSSLGGLYGTAAAVRLLGMGNTSIRLSLLSRNITSPLAMAIATILGADVSLAVTIVVLTGLFGANFGASILDAFGIKDAVARGLGIGAAAHGLGTAAFANEKDAFPFAAIAMALTASAVTVLISIPAVKKSVLSLALGV